MSLSLYKQKRKFDSTPEPIGGESKSVVLHFVVQKHAASHLHYDFRLEMRDVLKSWAVPKGPSMSNADKRLAMMVEDHPYDYKDFEGIIPSGYGAGTVIVWDAGTYEPEKPLKDKKANEKQLLAGLHKGKISIRLQGEKLKGLFALVKVPNRGENAWLLMKMKDADELKTDITKEDKSVISGKTLEQMATDKNAAEWESEKPAVKQKTAKKIKEITQPEINETISSVDGKKVAAGIKTAKKLIPKTAKTKMPADLAPMLATLVSKPVDGEGWLYEVKWDGYRAIAYNDGKEVELRSRNNKSFNEKFYPVFEAIKGWKVKAVVDGEIIVVNDKGISDFSALQNWRSEADGQLVFYLFDILWLDGTDLRELPLSERREILRPLIPEHDIIRLSDNFGTSGTEFFEVAKQMKLEGIIAKKADSFYHAGSRSAEWLKIKTETRQELVIGGYTLNEDSNKKFSALLVGWYVSDKLEYLSPVGTGYTDKLQAEILALLKPLEIKTCPFSTVPDVSKPSRFRPNPPKAKVTWVKPQLVAEVSYREVTKDGSLRHPSFKGLRQDKKAADVVRENPVATASAVEKEDNKTKRQKETTKKTDLVFKAGKNDRKTLLNPTDESQVRKVNGHELKFSNLSKEYWPEDHVTKRDMLNYYYQVAPFILPYLEDRPQSLNRFPSGIHGESFYQKDVTGKAPEWVKTFPYHTSDNEDKNFMVGSDEASLLYMANLGAIEMNPWNSRTQTPDNPDWCLIDLDPDTTNTFEQVIETALTVKGILDAIGVESFAKTSGSTGIHIYMPLAAQYSYDECQQFARLIATHTNELLPKFTSIKRMTNKRKGKLYIDFLQNRPKATLAAPYSLRPKPGATVSMPLHWEEVKKGLKMKDFHIGNAIARIKEQGDIFKGVLGKGIDMAAALDKMGEL